MRLRSLVLALLCASARALTSDGGSPPGKLDTKPKLQTEPPPPPPRLGVLSATSLGLGKLSPLKCYAMAAPYLKNPMAVPKRLLAFAGLMLFSFYMLLSALTSLASLLIRPQAAPSPSPNPDPNPKSTPNPNPDPSPASKPELTLRLRPQSNLMSLCASSASFHAGLFCLRGPQKQFAWLTAPERLPFTMVRVRVRVRVRVWVRVRVRVV